jgi:hypothetical protein
MIRICAWCRKIEDRDSGEWVRDEGLLKAVMLGLVHGERATHGICPDCADEMEEREKALDTGGETCDK